MPTPDEKLGRSLKWTLLGVLLFLAFVSVANARELAEIVEPSELSESWHDRKVMISGYARSCDVIPGRRQSFYMKCVVEGVDVYLDFKVWGVVHEKVIVLGKYQAHGRFGGLLLDRPFIIAESFFRDWK